MDSWGGGGWGNVVTAAREEYVLEAGLQWHPNQFSIFLIAVAFHLFATFLYFVSNLFLCILLQR
jgi:hypothetical protein